MRLLGNLNWWAPAPLCRLHEKIGLSESSAIPPGASSVDVPSEKLLEQPVPGDVSPRSSPLAQEQICRVFEKFGAEGGA